MELLCVLGGMAALFLLCAFLTLKAGLHSALAPLTALSLIVTWLTFCGVADLLLPGMWVLLAACAVLGAGALLPGKGGARPDFRALFTPGAALFWGLCLACAVYFFIRQPMATAWDELNLWATAVKVTKYNNRLYTTAVLGWPWQATQNPGLSLLAYFFSFFGSYADWKIYFAYDALFFAVFGAVLGGLRWAQYRISVPLAAVLWCVPYFFTTYNHTIYLNTAYMSAYGDIPAGMVLGGAAALWLALRRTGGPRWAVLPVLALGANVKSNTFVLSLVAAGLVAADAWLFPGDASAAGRFWRGSPDGGEPDDGAPARFGQDLARRTGFAALCLAAPLSVYLVWNRYIAGLVAANAAGGGMGETTPPLGAVVVNGVKMLLGRPVSAYFEGRRAQFYAAAAAMGHQFWSWDGRMSMVGQGCRVTALILALYAGACLVSGSRRLRQRAAVMALLTLPCFLGYNLMLLLSYGFIFKPDQAAALVDYNRYIYGFYIGWFLMALAWLALALQPVPARQAALPGAPAAPQKRYAGLPLSGNAALLCLAALMLFRLHQMVLPQLSVLGFSDSEFSDRKIQRARAAQVQTVAEPGQRVFYVCQGDGGLNWFSACFDLYPVIVDRSGFEGGTFGLAALKPENAGDTTTYYHPCTAQAFAALVAESGSAYLYVDKVDDIFVKSYAALFTDGLAGAQSGKVLLYRVTPQGYAPVETGEGALG